MTLVAVTAFTAGSLIFGATGSVAATVITSQQIKNGTIKNIDVAKGTLTADRLTAATVASLRGKTGVAGPQGAPGIQGVPGLPGAPGAKGAPGGEVRGTIYVWNASGAGTLADGIHTDSSTELPAGKRFRVLDLVDLTGSGLAGCQTAEGGVAGAFLSTDGANSNVPTVSYNRAWFDVGSQGRPLTLTLNCFDLVPGASPTDQMAISAKVVFEVQDQLDYTLADAAPFN